MLEVGGLHRTNTVRRASEDSETHTEHTNPTNKVTRLQLVFFIGNIFIGKITNSRLSKLVVFSLKFVNFTFKQ